MRKVTGVILVLICCFMTGCTRERTDGKNIAIENNGVDRNAKRIGWICLLKPFDT